MRITFREKPEDPVYPIMQGKTPMAKEFNKRQAKLYTDGKFIDINDEAKAFKQITTVLLEIFADEYDKNHTIKKEK